MRNRSSILCPFSGQISKSASAVPGSNMSPWFSHNWHTVPSFGGSPIGWLCTGTSFFFFALFLTLGFFFCVDGPALDVDACWGGGGLSCFSHTVFPIFALHLHLNPLDAAMAVHCVLGVGGGLVLHRFFGLISSRIALTSSWSCLFSTRSLSLIHIWRCRRRG